jgi:transposase-like protein
VTSIAADIGYPPQPGHEWVKRAELDGKQRTGVSTGIADSLKALEWKNCEPPHSDEILRKASAYFATAELDCRSKP